MAPSRWGTRGLDNAVAVVVQRHDELNRQHLVDLAAALLSREHDETPDRNDRAEERERQRLLQSGGYQVPALDLTDLKLKSRRELKEYPKKGSLRWHMNKRLGRPTEPPAPTAPQPPAQTTPPHTPRQWPKWV